MKIGVFYVLMIVGASMCRVMSAERNSSAGSYTFKRLPFHYRIASQSNEPEHASLVPSDNIHRFALEWGMNIFYYHYHEIFDSNIAPLLGIDSVVGTPKSDEYGFTQTAQVAAFLSPPRTPLYFVLSLDTGPGVHQYDGSTQQSMVIGEKSVACYVPYKVKKINFFLNTSFHTGFLWNVNSWLSVGPLAGIDYKCWIRDFKDMNETYHSFYLSSGLKTVYTINRKLLLGFNVFARHMFFGKMGIRFKKRSFPLYTEDGSVLTDITAPYVTLGNRLGIKSELPIHIIVNDNFTVAIKPWIEYRAFGNSNVDYLHLHIERSSRTTVEKVAFLEPSSTSYSLGISLTFPLTFISTTAPRSPHSLSHFTH